MTPKSEIFGQKYAHFGGFEGSFWTILRVKKVVFWKFSKLFRSCLGTFKALFSDTYTLCYPQQTFSFGVPRMPYPTKNPQDFDCFQNLSPLQDTCFQNFYCAVVVVVAVGRIYLSVFFGKKMKVFFLFFLNVFSYQGERFSFCFMTNKPKIELVGR